MKTDLERSYAQMVTNLLKPGEDIKESITPQKWGELLYAIGKTIEAGNRLDAVKKEVFYNKEGLAYVSFPQEVPNLQSSTWNLIHLFVGKAGEAVELLENVFKFLEEGQMDFKNIIEELGDDEFYTEGIRQALYTSRNEYLQYNMDKLINGHNARYSEGTYSDKAAQERRDKNNE